MESIRANTTYHGFFAFKLLRSEFSHGLGVEALERRSPICAARRMGAAGGDGKKITGAGRGRGAGLDLKSSMGGKKGLGVEILSGKQNSGVGGSGSVSVSPAKLGSPAPGSFGSKKRLLLEAMAKARRGDMVGSKRVLESGVEAPVGNLETEDRVLQEKILNSDATSDAGERSDRSFSPDPVDEGENSKDIVDSEVQELNQVVGSEVVVKSTLGEETTQSGVEESKEVGSDQAVEQSGSSSKGGSASEPEVGDSGDEAGVSEEEEETLSPVVKLRIGGRRGKEAVAVVVEDGGKEKGGRGEGEDESKEGKLGS